MYLKQYFSRIMFQCKNEDNLEFETARRWLYRLAPTLDYRFSKYRVASGLTQTMYDCLKDIIKNKNDTSEQDLDV